MVDWQVTDAKSTDQFINKVINNYERYKKLDYNQFDQDIVMREIQKRNKSLSPPKNLDQNALKQVSSNFQRANSNSNKTSMQTLRKVVVTSRKGSLNRNNRMIETDMNFMARKKSQVQSKSKLLPGDQLKIVTNLPLSSP